MKSNGAIDKEERYIIIRAERKILKRKKKRKEIDLWTI